MQMMKPKAHESKEKENAAKVKEPESATYEKRLTLPVSVAEEIEPFLTTRRDSEVDFVV